MEAAARTVLEERTRYDPAVVEPAVFARWQEAHAFDANPGDPGEPYTIAIPPPNVTGALHMGHALNDTIQDVLIRLAPHAAATRRCGSTAPTTPASRRRRWSRRRWRPRG